MSDFWGIAPECGCVTAWMMGEGATKAEIRAFYLEMGASGRDVRQTTSREEFAVLKEKLGRCMCSSSEESTEP